MTGEFLGEGRLLRFGVRRHALILALVLLYTAGFQLVVLDRPFAYDMEGAAASEIGIWARNYLRFDWAQTRGMPVLTVGQHSTAPIVLHPDHPPLIPLLVAAFYAGFGVGEWQARLPMSIMLIAAVCVLYRLLARTATRRAGVVAATVFAACPMMLFFGGMPDPSGTPLILFILLSVVGYLRFHAEPRLSTFMPFFAAFGIASLCDWPGYVIAPVFLAHFIVTKPRTEWPWIVAFGGAACALFAAVYVYITLATHSPWTWMLPRFARHSTAVGAQAFTLMEWLGTAFDFNRRLHTVALLIASGLWLVIFGVRFRRPPAGATVARLLIAWGVACVVIGNTAAYTHESIWIFLTPGIAVTTALLIEWLCLVAEQHRVAAVMGPGVALVVAAFATWTAYTTYGRLYPTTPAAPFTPMEMGQAIQAAAPGSGDLALVVGGDGGPGAQLWFYGDRALRVNIWSISEVEERLTEDWADLVYNFDVQPWKATATGIVFPRRWDDGFADVRVYLEERYPAVRLPPDLSDKFAVFTVPRP